MRNFKKILSLVLCMAMMLSVMVVGAGAAFKDQSKIVNTEAVDMCSALNIINGYTDGSFKPEGTITRAEACKMICVALNGGKEPVLGTNATATFTDIKGHWAESYIEYCVSEGIVAGIGGGKFNPNGNVTGSQFAKMLLIALGYRADHEQFVGSAWEVNVNVKATQKDLYDELEGMDPSVALTRDNAAQMVWNALNANEVAYEYTLATENGQLVSKVTVGDKGAPNDTITLLKDKYNTANDVIGIMGDISYDDKDAEYTYTIGKDKIEFDSSKDFTDLFGMKVKVVYTVKNGDKVVYGIIPEDSSVVVKDIIGNIDSLDKILADSWAEGDKVEVSDVEYKTDENITGYWFCNGTIARLDDVTAMTGYKAFNFVAIDNNDNDKIDTVVVYPVSVEKVTYAGTKSITANEPYTFEDDTIAKGIEKGDYVVVTKDQYTIDGKNVVAKAEVVSGEVTGLKTGMVQIDGTWYDVAVMKPVKVGSTYDFVVYNGYIFNADITAETSKDVLFVSAVGDVDKMVGENEGTMDARVYFANGDASTVITVSKVDGKKVDDNNKVNATWMYTYKVVGDNYELIPLRNADANNNVAENLAGYDGLVTSGVSYDNKKIGGMAIADDAVIFVKDNDSVKVLTGKQVKDWGNLDEAWGGGAMLYSETNGIDYVKIASLMGNSRPNADSDTQYGYLVADAYTTTYGEDKDDVIAYTIWNGKEETTVYAEYTSTPTLPKAGAVISYKVDGDYVINVATPAQLAAVKGFDYEEEGTMVYDLGASADVTATLDEDCVFIAIDSANTAKHEGGMKDIALAKSESTDNHTANAYIVVNSNGDKVLAVIFDIPNNEIDVADNEFADKVVAD